MSCATSTQKVLRQAAEATRATATAAKFERELAVANERAETLQERLSAAELRAGRAEAAQKEAVEQNAVAVAERRLVDESLARSDAMVGELRAERSALLARAAEAERLCSSLQQAVTGRSRLEQLVR